MGAHAEGAEEAPAVEEAKVSVLTKMSILTEVVTAAAVGAAMEEVAALAPAEVEVALVGHVVVTDKTASTLAAKATHAAAHHSSGARIHSCSALMQAVAAAEIEIRQLSFEVDCIDPFIIGNFDKVYIYIQES